MGLAQAMPVGRHHGLSIGSTYRPNPVGLAPNFPSGHQFLFSIGLGFVLFGCCSGWLGQHGLGKKRLGKCGSSWCGLVAFGFIWYGVDQYSPRKRKLIYLSMSGLGRENRFGLPFV